MKSSIHRSSQDITKHPRYQLSTTRMNLDAHSMNSASIASPFPKQQPAAGDTINESHVDALSSSTTCEAASAPVSPCLSELYLVSPPQRNTCNSSSNRVPPIRASLTPPPHSEKINRAIRAAESQLDAAVYDVHRYISQGCSDSARGEVARDFSGSPESDYSDDLLSPRVLPDFLSPMMGAAVGNEPVDSFSRMSYRRRILDDEGDNDAESRSSDAGDIGEGTPELSIDSKHGSCTDKENLNVSDDNRVNIKRNQQNDKGKRRTMRTKTPVSVKLTNEDQSETMELRTLQLVEGKFQVWPPLRSSGLLSFA
jgi:hypothetical protein